MNLGSRRIVQSSAPGNIFLLGEHSVVYERYAIISALGLRTTTKIQNSTGQGVLIESKDYGSTFYSLGELDSVIAKIKGSYFNVLDPAIDLIAFLFREYDISEPIEVSISSQIPRSSGGMSSSTAFLVSLLGAVNEYFSLDIKKNDFFNILYPFQVKIHGGAASGSEFISSVYGGMHKIKIDRSNSKPDVLYERIDSGNLVFGVIDTGVEAKTSKTVPWIKDGWEKDPEVYENVFTSIEELVLKGEKALAENNLEELGNIMTQNQHILASDLGISHPRINRILESLDGSQIYGGKLSGGGGGGTIVTLLKDSANSSSISYSHLYSGNLMKATSEPEGLILTSF